MDSFLLLPLYSRGKTPFYPLNKRLGRPQKYRGADKSLARLTSLCILFDGENISFDASHALYTRIDNKVRELIAVKVLHTSLLNTTVVAFKVLPLGRYAPMRQRLVHPSKQFWNWFCGMAFRADVVLLLMSWMSSKCIPFYISFIFGNRKKSHWGLDLVNRHGFPTQLFVQ